MNKPKTNCPRSDCGRLIASKKFLVSKIDGFGICPHCYSKENYHRFDPITDILPKENNNVRIRTENKIKAVRLAKFNYNEPLLIKGEDVVLKQKYHFDDFKEGFKKCPQVQRVRKALIDTSNRIKIKNMADVEVKKSSDEQNRKFLEDFKKLK